MVAAAAYPLQECRNAVRRRELHHQIHSTNIDAQFHGCSGHQHLQFARLQLLLGVMAPLLAHTAMVGADQGRASLAIQTVGAQSLRQRQRQTFGQASGVNKYQGCAVLLNELHQPFVQLAPHLVAHQSGQRRGRDFNIDIQCATVPCIHDDRRGGRLSAPCANQIIGDQRHRFLRSGQADALQRASRQGLQALKRQGQM